MFFKLSRLGRGTISVGGDALVKPEVSENLRGASPIPPGDPLMADGEVGGVPPIPVV